MKRNLKPFAGIIFILFFLKFFIWYLLPIPFVDGPWDLSHCFSLLNGNFFFNTFSNKPDPFIFSFIGAPFFYLLGANEYSIYIFFGGLLILQLSLFFYYLRLQKNVPIKIVLGLILILSINPSFHYFRFESVQLFLLTLFIVMDGMKRFDNKGGMILKILIHAVVILVHPPGGVFSLIFINHYLLSNDIGLRRVLIYNLLLCFLCFGLLVPYLIFSNGNFSPGLNALDIFLFRIKNYSLYTFADYFKYSFPLVVLFLYFMSKGLSKREFLMELLTLGGYLFVLSLFNKPYYFIFLSIFFVWRLPKYRVPETNYSPLFIPLFTAGLFYFIFIPGVQLFDNFNYSVTARAVFREIKGYDQIKSNKIFIEPDFAMPLLGSENSRILIFHSNSGKINLWDEISEGDYFLVTGEIQLNILIDLLEPDFKPDVKLIINPVRGLVIFSSLFRRRGPDIGLWEVRATKKTDTHGSNKKRDYSHAE